MGKAVSILIPIALQRILFRIPNSEFKSFRPLTSVPLYQSEIPNPKSQIEPFPIPNSRASVICPLTSDL
jgi:hypothetical protein